jgi:hypothetical protein
MIICYQRSKIRQRREEKEAYEFVENQVGDLLINLIIFSSVLAKYISSNSYRAFNAGSRTTNNGLFYL